MSARSLKHCVASLLIACVTASSVLAAAPLEFEKKIPLGDVKGRIDHLAADLKHKRLFVAELGNDSVAVVDLIKRKLLHTITGLKRPQGVGYHEATDTLYVTNAADGSVRMFRGSDYTYIGQIDLNNDADNIRIDPVADRIFVGYGDGALAIIDPNTHRKITDVKLNAHPESFQLDKKGRWAFVNVPDAHAISVVDRVTGRTKKNWRVAGAQGNFPMAIDELNSHVAVGFRTPPILRGYSMQRGGIDRELEICGDSDDIFFDGKRKRLYVSCGAGFIDVVDSSGRYKRVGRIPTARGARTSLFLPELDRLYLAVRSSSTDIPAIWIYRPVD